MISAPLPTEVVEAARQVKGYKIGGRQHKVACRCRACRVVRMRARERAVVVHTFVC